MLSSLFRSKKSRQRIDHSPFSSPFQEHERSPLLGRRTERNADVKIDHSRQAGNERDLDSEGNEEDGLEGDPPSETEEEDSPPLLPLFSASHLDSLPVYDLTHIIRDSVTSRCETTLTWDQIRSPQVSSFLVRPIQQGIRDSHLSRATIFAILANCLQFSRESYANPANSGISRTRALLSELLAMKILREYSPRELIDALSYDFNPLQGMEVSQKASLAFVLPTSSSRALLRAPRISALELAIQAQAKRFLSHPVVVQHLQAIWAGNIVFHSAADSLHRHHDQIGHRSIRRNQHGEGPAQNVAPERSSANKTGMILPLRRSVTIYNPQDASLFKLSRLRVPRYRQVLSTLSLAILLGLYITVLVQRSSDITALEIVFWVWSAGFMLDELVGFTEQGFSLYIISVWNSFDLGILLILFVYYVMRLYGIFLFGEEKHEIQNLAYDVLAANAVLLFPRLFSVLDHSRYFSQLLIAFRMMAMDLVAVFLLIIISCSGFFVAFTLSFGENNYDPKGVVYSLFQILMGFTPAAWNAWDSYNTLGKLVLTLFLFICHFLIVTILITVLTNSFMAIVANANDEHQYLFAVNTISLVKSDALFCYIAPTNVLAWTITPLRYLVSFRQFVKVNRTMIKITHFPILFAIFVYERVFLGSVSPDFAAALDPTVKPRDVLPVFNNKSTQPGFFNPDRLRKGSVANLQAEQALEAVFSHAGDDETFKDPHFVRPPRRNSNAVNDWMQGMGSDGRASPPMEQPESEVGRIEAGMSLLHPSRATKRRPSRLSDRLQAGSRSVASDPENFSAIGTRNYSRSGLRREVSHEDLTEESESSEESALDADVSAHDQTGEDEDLPDDSPTRIKDSSLQKDGSPEAREEQRGRNHFRQASISTVLFSPTKEDPEPTSTSKGKSTVKGDFQPKKKSGNLATKKQRSPERPRLPASPTSPLRARPVMPRRQQFASAPNIPGLLSSGGNLGADPARQGRSRYPPLRRRSSSFALDLTSDLGPDDIHDNLGLAGGAPASFATQVAFHNAAAGRRRRDRRLRDVPERYQYGSVVSDQQLGGSHAARRRAREEEDDARMMNRLMLARMKTLEEGFREVVKEVKELKGDRSVS